MLKHGKSGGGTIHAYKIVPEPQVETVKIGTGQVAVVLDEKEADRLTKLVSKLNALWYSGGTIVMRSNDPAYDLSRLNSALENLNG